MKKLFKIVGLAVLIFGLIQLIPIDRTKKPINKSENITDIYKTPKNIENSLRKACYDCHSNETVYPDYAYIAPISWSIQEHINAGRGSLNFSIWATFNKDLKESMLKNTIGDLKENRMPIRGYTVYHPEANLSKQEIDELISYFENILETGNY